MVPLIATKINLIADLCERFGVKRLELFGSAARFDFDLQKSDVDFFVEFISEDWHGAADHWFGLKESLEEVLGRPVDLVSAPDVRNKYFLEVANRDRIEIYAARSQEIS